MLFNLSTFSRKCMKCEEAAVTIARTKDPFCRYVHVVLCVAGQLIDSQVLMCNYVMRELV